MPDTPAIQLRALVAIFLRVTPRVPAASKAASFLCDMRVRGQFPRRVRRDISCSLHADVTMHRAASARCIVRFRERLKDRLEQPVYRSAPGGPGRADGEGETLRFSRHRCAGDTWLQNKAGEIRKTFYWLAQDFHLAKRAGFKRLRPATWRHPTRRPAPRRCRQTCARVHLSSASCRSRIARRHCARWGRLRP